MLYTFSCPLPPTLNDQIADARGNKFKSSTAKKKWTALIANTVKDSPAFPGKVWIAFDWFVKNQQRDPDNIMASAKYIMDGLKVAGTIKDDNLTIIQSPQIHRFAKEKSDSVTITLSDSPDFLIEVIKSTPCLLLPSPH